MADETLAFDLLVRDRNASRTLKNVGDAATKTGRDFDKASGGAGHLAAQIEETTLRLKELGEEFDRTGDKSLLKDIGRERRTLAGLTKLRTEMADLGGDAATEFAAKFLGSLGHMAHRVPFGPVGLVIGAGIGAAAAPVLASAISGAVTLGVAGGAVAGGVALAAQDPKVKAAATGLGMFLSTEMSQAASAFEDETIAALGIVRQEFTELRPEIEGLFTDAAKYVQPFTRAVTGAVREMVPGLRTAVREAEPLVDMFEVKLPSAGRTLGDTFAMLASTADTSADAFAAVLGTLEAAVGGTALTIKTLSEIAPYVAGPMFVLGDVTSKDAQAADEAAYSNQGLAEALRQAEADTRAAEQAIRDHLSALSAMEDATRGQRNAVWDLKDGIAGLAEQTQRYGTSLDENTPKGRENLRYLDDLFAKADRAGDEAERLALANGQGAEASAAAGAKVRSGWISALEDAATKAGFSRQKIDEMVAAARAADETRVRIYLDQIFRTFGKPYSDVTGIGGNTFRGYSHGGPVHGPGPKGVDSVAAMLAPGEFVLKSAAVDRIGLSTLRALNQGRAAAAATGGSSGPAAGGVVGPLVLNYSGGSGLEDMFVKWLHQSIREGRLQLSAGGSKVKVG